MVVKGVPAAPVHEPDPRVGQALPVEVEGLARLEQHVGQAGERDGGAHRVRPLGQGGGMAPEGRAADVAERAVAAAESAAREPDLPEHRRQRDHHPRRLLAVLSSLEGPVRVDERPARRHPARERPDRRRGDPGDPLRPLGRLGRPVVRATEVALEAVEARAVAPEELAVRALLGDERVGEAQHERDVGTGDDREPLGVQELGQVVPHRAHQDELGPAGPHGAQVVPERVAARAPGAHHRVLERDAPEADEELGVALDHGPRSGAVQVAPHVAQHVGHDHGQGAVTVRVLPAHEAAETVEEAVELALRVVEAPRAGPSVGASVHRLAAVGVVDAPELSRQEIDGGRPADRHEGLGAPAPVGSRAAVEPAGADHRLRDARAVTEAPGDVAEERRRVRVLAVGVDRDDGAVLDLRLEGAPVGRVELPLGRHVALSRGENGTAERAGTSVAARPPCDARPPSSMFRWPGQSGPGGDTLTDPEGRRRMSDGRRVIANIGILLNGAAAERERLAAAGARVVEARGGSEDELRRLVRRRRGRPRSRPVPVH